MKIIFLYFKHNVCFVPWCKIKLKYITVYLSPYTVPYTETIVTCPNHTSMM